MPKRNRYILFLLPLLFSACAKKAETQDEYIRRSLAERIEAHTQTKKQKCHQELLKKATNLADSILLKEALQLDSLQEKLPTVPPKPAFMEPKPIADSIPVKPFLNKESAE